MSTSLITGLSVNVALTLAWRNLWRNHRRTLIMLLAIALGVWAMIFMTAMMRGMVYGMLGDGIRSLPGHVQIHHADYPDDPSVVNSFTEPDEALRRALASKEVKAWSMRVRVPAVIASERESRGVTLLGVDAAAELGLSITPEDLLQGEFLPPGRDRGIVIGARLATELETALGKRIVIMSQTPDNRLVDRGFVITGIYRSATPGQELRFAYAERRQVQALLELTGRISEIAVMGADYRDTSQLQARLSAAVPAGLKVQNWQQLDSYLGAMLTMMDGFVLVWILVIFLALSFGLINTLFMAVFERVREIGLMQALGMRRSFVVRIILIESLLLLLLGLLLGNSTALLTLSLIRDGIDVSAVAEGMAMFGAGAVLYPALERQDLLLADTLVVVLGLLTCLYPAWRASTCDPIMALTKT